MFIDIAYTGMTDLKVRPNLEFERTGCVGISRASYPNFFPWSRDPLARRVFIIPYFKVHMYLIHRKCFLIVPKPKVPDTMRNLIG